MTGGQKAAAAIAGVGVAGIGGWVLYRTQNGQSILPKSVGGSSSSTGSGTGSQPGLLQTGSIYGGLNVTIPSNPNAGTYVSGGPAPGARGEQLYPALWAVASKTVPGFVKCQNGTGWVVIAVNLNVSGTYNGQSASAVGPWIGIAEYTNRQLVRVYPQRATGSSQTTLWSYSGFYC